MIRLDKILVELGYGSRKVVKELVRKGIVRVNDQIIKNSDYKVSEDDVIKIDGEIIKYKQHVYYLLNKPKGYLSATESTNYPTVLELVPYRSNLFPVGRLDLDTEGLLIITNDGGFAHEIINPKHNVEKEYYFKYSGKLIPDAKKKCQEGININNEYISRPAKLEILNEEEGKIIITEGKYHEVKRIIHELGGEVIYLKRIRIKDLILKDIEVGEYRELTNEEVQTLLKK